MKQFEQDDSQSLEIERAQLHRRQMAEAAYFKGERRGEAGLDEWLRTEWNIAPEQ